MGVAIIAAKSAPRDANVVDSVFVEVSEEAGLVADMLVEVIAEACVGVFPDIVAVYFSLR